MSAAWKTLGATPSVFAAAPAPPMPRRSAALSAELRPSIPSTMPRAASRGMPPFSCGNASEGLSTGVPIASRPSATPILACGTGTVGAPKRVNAPAILGRVSRVCASIRSHGPGCSVFGTGRAAASSNWKSAGKVCGT